MGAGEEPVEHLPEQLVLNRGKKNAPHAVISRAPVVEEIAAAVDRELMAPLHQPPANLQRNLLSAGVAMWDAAGADEGDAHPPQWATTGLRAAAGSHHRRIAAATSLTCAWESSGNIGRLNVCAATRSATGKDPGPRASRRYASWRCSVVG